MKRLSTLFLAVLFVLSFSVGCFADDAIQEPSYEPGSNVYCVYTPQHLNWISRQVENGYDFSGCEIRLMNDLDFRGQEFCPIGTFYTQFNGCFNGNGHAIDYVSIALQDCSYVGIFSYIGVFGEVRNLTIERHCKVNGDFCQVGGLAGYNAGNIVHCCSKASVSSSIGSCAKVVGYNDFSGCIDDCQVSFWAKSNASPGCSNTYVVHNLGSCSNCKTFFFYPW